MSCVSSHFGSLFQYFGEPGYMCNVTKLSFFISKKLYDLCLFYILAGRNTIFGCRNQGR